MARFNVASLIGRLEGTRQHFKIDEVLDQNRVRGRVTLLKLPHEINVHIQNLETDLKERCSRCLKPVTLKIRIPDAEREYIIDLPKSELATGEDVFYVDRIANEIDLDGMIREEIVLHFPAAALCSESCKGLCDQCGANRNEKKCSCVPKSSMTFPFKRLKI